MLACGSVDIRVSLSLSYIPEFEFELIEFELIINILLHTCLSQWLACEIR